MITKNTSKRAKYIGICAGLPWNEYNLLLSNPWSSLWNYVFSGDVDLLVDISKMRSQIALNGKRARNDNRKNNRLR